MSLTSVPDLLSNAGAHGCESQRLGLVAAEKLVEGDLGVIGLLVGSAKSLREAGLLACSVYRLVSDAGQLELVEGERTSKFRLIPAPGHSVPPPLAVFAMATTARVARRLTERDLPASQVTFVHGAPSSTREFDAFFRCPISFGGDSIAIEFPTAYLHLALPRADSAERNTLLEVARHMLETRSRSASIVNHVLRAITDGMGRGEHRLGDVARRLGMDARTLQRRLQATRTSYGDLLDSVRREHALYAARDRVPAHEIARRLGLRDRTALARAFRRWTGTTPRSYMSRATNDA